VKKQIVYLILFLIFTLIGLIVAIPNPFLGFFLLIIAGVFLFYSGYITKKGSIYNLPFFEIMKKETKLFSKIIVLILFLLFILIIVLWFISAMF